MARKRDERSGFQTADLNQSVIAALKKELFGETAPPGWFTIAQIAGMLDIGPERAERFCVRKKWEMRSFFASTADNKWIKQKHYFVK
jgi:hypothetical protein